MLHARRMHRRPPIVRIGMVLLLICCSCLLLLLTVVRLRRRLLLLLRLLIHGRSTRIRGFLGLGTGRHWRHLLWRRRWPVSVLHAGGRLSWRRWVRLRVAGRCLVVGIVGRRWVLLIGVHHCGLVGGRGAASAAMELVQRWNGREVEVASNVDDFFLLFVNALSAAAQHSEQRSQLQRGVSRGRYHGAQPHTKKSESPAP